MHKNRQTFRNDQSGLVSFIVVAVLMLVITVLILSFARIVSREQLQTLDRQLNTQALYAAESGANDAMAKIDSGSVPSNVDYDKCQGPGSFVQAATITPAQQSLGNNVSYSCLLVDPSPKELQFPGVNTQNSTITKINVKSGSIYKIEVLWDSNVKGATGLSCPAAGSFPVTLGPGCDVGMLRFEFVPFGAGQNRTNLIQNRAIGFLKPSSSGSSTGTMSQFTGNSQGTPVLAHCDTAGVDADKHLCIFSITNVPTNVSYLMIRSIYRDTPVTIRAFNSGGQQLELVESQVEVDVTGRAGGVIKRIKQRRPIKPSGNKGITPDFALQSTNTICKQFTYIPGGTPSSITPPPSLPASFCDPKQP